MRSTSLKIETQPRARGVVVVANAALAPLEVTGRGVAIRGVGVARAR